MTIKLFSLLSVYCQLTLGYFTLQLSVCGDYFKMSILLKNTPYSSKFCQFFQATRWALKVSGWNKDLEKSPLCPKRKTCNIFPSFFDTTIFRLTFSWFFWWWAFKNEKNMKLSLDYFSLLYPFLNSWLKFWKQSTY